METIRAIVKSPTEPVGHVEEIENSLEALQTAVGGYIEVLTNSTGEVVFLMNEEGMIHGLPQNIRLGSHIIYGTIVVLGKGNDGEFIDCPLSLADWKINLSLWGNNTL